MKNLLTIFLFISLFINAKDISPKSTITDVTVYLNGANINRSCDVNLAKGKHTIRLNGITTHINENSIQVNSNIPITLLSVKSEINYLEDLSIPKRLQALNDTLQILTVQRKNELNGKFSYEQELDLILQNKNLKGQETLTIEDISEMTELYRKLIPEIKSKMLIADLLIDKLDKQINKVHQEINQKKSFRNKPESIILIEIEANSNLNGKLFISYFTPSARWEPFYDIRAKDIISDIDLTYKSKVFQATGNNWNNIKLTLSTGNPSLNGNVPDMEIWRLNYYQRKNDSKNKRNLKAVTYSYGLYEGDDKDGNIKPSAKSIQKLATAQNSIASSTISNETGTNINFNINVPYSVLSGATPQIVEIQKSSIPSEFSYVAIPKLDPDAFLLARLTNWDQLNLLPGESSIFFEGNYVGTSFLDPFETNDTLDISLGRDKNIVIDRIKDFESCKNNTFGANKKETIAWNIEIRNRKDSKIKLLIKDQIPVASRKEIEVALEEKGDASYNEKTGELEWILDLEQSQNETIGFRYSVKFPKNQNIKLQ